MGNGIELVHCLLLSIVIAQALSHGFVEGRRVVKDRELVRHKAAVKTIESEGDVIDCVDIYKQPAFDHPLLKNHKIQMKPSSYPNGMKADNYTVKFTQPWHKNGQCPKGTIPIKRTREHDFSRFSGHGKKLGHILVDDPAAHEYASVTESRDTYYGAEVIINLWNPTLEVDSELSLSQIWINGGNPEDFNSVEAGLIVYPELYGDRQTRVFIYWTSDNYKSKGCYNLKCPGFVQTDQSIAIGAMVTPVSNYGGDQFDVNFLIFKDQTSGNWWLKILDKVVGYWPSSIFTTLAESSNAISWGGEIYNSRPQGHHTATQMGSAHFPYEGYRKSSYMRNLRIVDSTYSIIPPLNLVPFVTNPACYDLQMGAEGTNYGTHFYYGGPGFSNQCP